MLAEASLLVALTVQHGPGAEACLAEPRLKRSVERRLRRRVFADPASAQLRFVVTYTVRGSETEARVEVSSIDGTPRGARTLVTSSHCSALDDSLALSVSLLADEPPDPEPAGPSPSAAGSGAVTALPPPAPRAPTVPTVITIPADVAAPREPWHVQAGAALQGAVGVVPGFVPGVALHVRVVPRDFVPTTLSGEAFASGTAERDSAAGARFRLLRVGLSWCPPVWRPGPELSVCFGQKVGWLRVDGFGFDHVARERRLTYALHLGVELRQRLFSVLSLRGAASAEVPLVRDRFVSTGRDATELFRPAPVALSAQLGLEATLW